MHTDYDLRVTAVLLAASTYVKTKPLLRRKKADHGSSSLKAEVKAKARQLETLRAAGGGFSLSLTARDLTRK